MDIGCWFAGANRRERGLRSLWGMIQVITVMAFQPTPPGPRTPAPINKALFEGLLTIGFP